jgi:hypothetical protein
MYTKEELRTLQQKIQKEIKYSKGVEVLKVKLRSGSIVHIARLSRYDSWGMDEAGTFTISKGSNSDFNVEISMPLNFIELESDGDYHTLNISGAKGERVRMTLWAENELLKLLELFSDMPNAFAITPKGVFSHDDDDELAFRKR